MLQRTQNLRRNQGILGLLNPLRAHTSVKWKISETGFEDARPVD